MPSDAEKEPLHYGPGRLQTYTIWRSPSSPPPSTSETSTSTPPLWILYVHGGAWRDPLQSSTNILPTVQHLESLMSSSSAPALADPTRFAGIISIDYRLSHHPNHPTCPSDPADPERNVQHPAHVRDLAAAVAHARKQHGVERWVGVGHSCGATMLLHYIAGVGLNPDDTASSSSSSPQVSTSDFDFAARNQGLEALILLEGIYSIPRLLANHAPPACPENIAQIYVDFTKGAFGEDTGGVYDAVSPVTGNYDTRTWAGGRRVVVAYSGEDELVEREQGELLVQRLVGEGGWAQGSGEGEGVGEAARVVDVKELRGTHDFVWRDGRQIADLIAEVVERL